MNDTHKLLLAFIEASGFDVEELRQVEFYGSEYETLAESPNILPGIEVSQNEKGKYQCYLTVFDYKLTKKEDIAIFYLKQCMDHIDNIDKCIESAGVFDKVWDNMPSHIVEVGNITRFLKEFDAIETLEIKE